MDRKIYTTKANGCASDLKADSCPEKARVCYSPLLTRFQTLLFTFYINSIQSIFVDRQLESCWRSAGCLQNGWRLWEYGNMYFNILFTENFIYHMLLNKIKKLRIKGVRGESKGQYGVGIPVGAGRWEDGGEMMLVEGAGQECKAVRLEVWLIVWKIKVCYWIWCN